MSTGPHEWQPDEAAAYGRGVGNILNGFDCAATFALLLDHNELEWRTDGSRNNSGSYAAQHFLVRLESPFLAADDGLFKSASHCELCRNE